MAQHVMTRFGIYGSKSFAFRVRMHCALGRNAGNHSKERKASLPTLYLVRHGQTDWNSEGRLQGHSDRPLDTVGRIQASAIAARLSTVSLDAIWASDLSRAQATARAIAVYHNLPVNTDTRLREVGYGRWEGRRIADLAQLYPEAVARWRADPPTYVPPGAETPEAVKKRVAGFLSEMKALPDDRHVLVVAHGGTLRLLLSLLSPWPEGRGPRAVVHTASLSRVFLTGDRGTILLLDDRSHLVEVDQLTHTLAPV